MLLAFAFLVSGAAGLIYQVVWTRLLVLVFGSTTLAVSTVLTIFMGGLALGAWLAGRWIDRSARPLAVYAAIEAGIALSAVMIPWGLDRLLPVYQTVWTHVAFAPGVLLGVRFALIALVLLIPTMLMGATLPVLSRAIARGEGTMAGRVGRFYAINTAGAIGGAFATGFVLLPALGITPTIRIGVLCNLLAAAAAWMSARRGIGEDGARHGVGHSVSPAPQTTLGRVVGVTLALSGAAALVDEVVWSRALSLILGSSVYAFTSMLTTFLIDRKSTRLNSSHIQKSRMPSSA